MNPTTREKALITVLRGWLRDQKLPDTPEAYDHLFQRIHGGSCAVCGRPETAHGTRPLGQAVNALLKKYAPDA